MELNNQLNNLDFFNSGHGTNCSLVVRTSSMSSALQSRTLQKDFLRGGIFWISSILFSNQLNVPSSVPAIATNCILFRTSGTATSLKNKYITREELVVKATIGLPFDSYGGHRHVKHRKCVTVMSVLNVYRR